MSTYTQPGRQSGTPPPRGTAAGRNRAQTMLHQDARPSSTTTRRPSGNPPGNVTHRGTNSSEVSQRDSSGNDARNRKRPQPLQTETVASKPFGEVVLPTGTSPRSPSRPRNYMGGTSGRVTAQNIFHKCCVSMCGRTCASKLEFGRAPPTWVRQATVWTLQRSIFVILFASLLHVCSHKLLHEDVGFKGSFIGSLVLYVFLLLTTIGVTSQRARSASWFFEAIVVTLVVCSVAASMYLCLSVEGLVYQEQALVFFSLVWKQVSLITGSRWLTCVALLLWVTVYDIAGLWLVQRENDSTLNVKDVVSPCIISISYGVFSWGIHRKMKDTYDHYRQLRLEREATASILSMVCDSVVWLSEDGETVSRSTQQFDHLIRQGMTGKKISSCFDTEREWQELREALRRAFDGPELFTCELRSITKRRIGVDIIVVNRANVQNKTSGNLIGQEAQGPGFLLGVRSSRLSLSPQGNPTSQPMAMGELPLELPEYDPSEEYEALRNGNLVTNQMPPSPPPLMGEKVFSQIIPQHLRCIRCGGTGYDPMASSSPAAVPSQKRGGQVSVSNGLNGPLALEGGSLGEDAYGGQGFGAQSLRGLANQDPMSSLEFHPHAMECFETFMQMEEAMYADWAVFYHSYSSAALIYELHAALAAALFGFPAGISPLPRIRFSDFWDIPNATTLIDMCNMKFANTSARRDHHPEFRAVAIPAVCSLVSTGPGVSTPVMFLTGLSQDDMSYINPIEEVLEALHLPKRRIGELAENMLALAELYNLDASQYGGQACQSGKSGHLLQMFVRRTHVDELAFASMPMGEVDNSRTPISSWLSGDFPTNFGQARVVAHPLRFMSTDSVRLYVASADPNFHHDRPKFQEDLIRLLSKVLDEENCRLQVATKIYGGTPPEGLMSGIKNDGCNVQ